MKRILIIDYGMGNLKSVFNALVFLGYKATIGHRIEQIRKADGYILPGVGAFAEAMESLQKLDIIESLRPQVLQNKKPFLGICLGLQLLAKSSEEKGYHSGFGWIPGCVRKVDIDDQLRLPHVGWNEVKFNDNAVLFKNLKQESSFYFDHSYQLCCESDLITGFCDYGEKIIASIQKGNIFATQFHPEKSQVNGLKLLRNFLNYVEAVNG